MKKRTIIAAALVNLLVFSSCAQPRKAVVAPPGDESVAVAFPGAEGYGKYTTGGRGGKVVVVTNLDDDGPGSLRAALKSKQPKIVVFAVSGTIHLLSKLNISANTTIAGQTAPGDGICIADHPVSLNGDNIIIRYLRIRMGDRHQNRTQVHGSGHDDALSGQGRKHIIIDHCSLSWSTDEVFSVYGGDSTTLQWNIISEPLNYSYHFETGDKDFENHGYGGIWGGRHLSAHHNLFAHCLSRNPRFGGIRTHPEEMVDFRNNVIYNWGDNSVYGGEGGRYNLVGNYYKSGPVTKKSVQSRIVNPSKTNDIDYGRFFVEGNFVDGFPEVTGNNLLGVHMNKDEVLQPRDVVVAQPFTADGVRTQTAERAFKDVMEYGGASLPVRDTLDARILNDVKNRKGRLIDVQGGYPHGTPYEQTANAWPALKSTPAPADSDSDGMPDDWEKKNGLNPADASDAAGLKLHRFYTNIEVYINSLTDKSPA
ncbi:MAG TPA: pectate lyase [Flavisolibacter sp.]|jgi:hypothetical protein